MAAKILLLLVVEWLCFSNVPAKITRNSNIKIAEGEACSTSHVANGVCTREQNCDQDFLHSLEHSELSKNECEQHSHFNVYCCISVLELCKQKKTHHILHGNVSDPIPFHVRVGKKIDNHLSWKCAGSVISSRYVLTAAHCAPDTELVGLGCVNATHCDQYINVLNVISHPKYKRRYKHHDVALALLDKVIMFNRYVLPVCPYSTTEDLPEIESLKIAGWGATETKSSSANLMFTMVRTVPFEECKEWYSRHSIMDAIRQRTFPSHVTNELYCARGMFVEMGSHSDACQGDSGGPLFRLNPLFVVGIVATGLGCGSEAPGLYTRVGVYFEWIKQHVEAPLALS